MRRNRPQPLNSRPSRFSPTPRGFERFRAGLEQSLAESTWKKYRPILERLEELRVDLFQDAPWSELDDETIAIDLMNALFDECHGRGGGPPSTNTLRGRYDACIAYFEFLRLIRVIARNPLDLRGRPSSKALHKPWLTEVEDRKLFELEKVGHELAVYALARGCGLREGEIAALEDSDVDLEEGIVFVRKGRTRRATREVPLFPTTVILLARYREWRDKNVGRDSSRFVRTRSGRISPAYIWKLVKKMALQAELRLSEDENGRSTTDVTPHSLRRTLGSDLRQRGVPLDIVSEILGHASSRVTEESYAFVDRRVRARAALAAAGEGPFSLGAGVSEIERELAAAENLAAADPQEAISALRQLRVQAEAVEQRLVRLFSKEDTPWEDNAPNVVDLNSRRPPGRPASAHLEWPESASAARRGARKRSVWDRGVMKAAMSENLRLRP